MSKIDVSIIIVNYKVDGLVIDCIKSIVKNTNSISFEIIVVDNYPKSNLLHKLKKISPHIIYIKSKSNVGFGSGNNLGAKYAKGNYLFFLNPDTKIYKNTLDILYNFLQKNKEAGIVSPLIINNNFKTFKEQGYKQLTPLRAIFSYSFLRKIFPGKTIYENYSLENWKIKPVKEVEAVTGASLMIPTKLFNKINGFDEKFFLYFEENDISKRIRNLGYKLYINSNSKVMHEVGESTKQLKNMEKIFSESRFLYFKKHFGLVKAILINALIKINLTFLAVVVSLIIGFFLRFYNLSNNMQFIGDQGWFYLSARDLLMYAKIPLVGITSSHLWLHQGPLWTYMLSVMLFISNFNPLSGAYLTAILGVLTIFLMYKLGTDLFSKKVGIVAAFLYSVSPLIVFYDRIPFDPSPIPLFTVLFFYSLVKWLKGQTNYFPFILFFIAVLYNLELATFTLFFPFTLILLYCFYKKNACVRNILNKKIMIYSFFAVLIPMFTVIIYDFSHGFKQTIVFFGWTLYKPFSFLVKHAPSNFIENQYILFNFLYNTISHIVFSFYSLIAFSIFIFAFIYLIYTLFKKQNRKLSNSKCLLFLFLIVSVGGILINQTPSDAYLPVTFPFIIYTIAIFTEFILSKKYIKYFALLLFLIVLLLNIYSSVLSSSTNSFRNRLVAVNQIIALTKGQKYNLVGKGLGSQFISFTMNYEYLLWWKDDSPTKLNSKLKIYIYEQKDKILIYKKYD